MKAPQTKQNSPRVCLVAKNGPEQAVLSAILGRSGCKVETFEGAAQGLEALRRESYLFVVIMAPVADMHWLTMLRILRSDEHSDHIPVILLLEQDTKLDRRERELLSSYHVDHVMELSYAESLLKPVITELVGRGSQKDQVAEKLRQAKALYKQGLQKQARRIYDEILKERSDSLSARTGLIYAERDQLDTYMKQLQYVLEADPENYNYKFELLQFYFSRGEWAKFQTLFDVLLNEINESNEQYWLLQLGEVCLSLNLTLFCEKIAAVMLDRPETVETWKPYLLKARVGLSQGDMAIAQQWLTKAESLSGRDRPEILNMRGIMKRKDGKDLEALDLFKRAFEVAADDHRLAFNIALCYRNLKQDQEAINHLQRALQICPTYKRAREMLQKMSS